MDPGIPVVSPRAPVVDSPRKAPGKLVKGSAIQGWKDARRASPSSTPTASTRPVTPSVTHITCTEILTCPPEARDLGKAPAHPVLPTDRHTSQVLGWKTPPEVFEDQLRFLQQPSVATTG